MPKSVKNTLRNSFFQTFGAFTITGLNFILILIYAHLLGPEGLGDLSTSQAQVLIWVTLVDLGLSSALISALTLAEGETLTEGESSELARQGFRTQDLINRVLFIRLVGASVGSIFIYIFSWQHATDVDGVFNEEIFWQAMAYVPYLFSVALMLTADAYCKFRGRQGLGVVSVLIGVLATVLLPAYLAFQGYGITYLLLAQSWGGILSAFIIWVTFFLTPTRPLSENLAESATNCRESRRISRKLSFSSSWGITAWHALTKDAWPYAITFGAVVLWQRLDLITASHLLGFAEAGLYVLAVRLSAVPILMATSVGHAIFPDLQSVGRDAPAKVVIYIGAFTKFLFRYGVLIGAGILLFLSGLIYPFFPKYKVALELLPWFLPGIWAYWLHSFIVGGLFSLRRYRDVVLSYITAACVYLLVLIPLTKLFGLVGVALASNTFPIVLFICVYQVAKRYEILPKDFRISGSYTYQEARMVMEVKRKSLGFLPFVRT